MTEVKPKLVPCGHCKRKLFRLADREHAGTLRNRVVYTRTLLGGRLVPSCSLACAEVLRAKMLEEQQTLNPQL